MTRNLGVAFKPSYVECILQLPLKTAWQYQCKPAIYRYPSTPDPIRVCGQCYANSSTQGTAQHKSTTDAYSYHGRVSTLVCKPRTGCPAIFMKLISAQLCLPRNIGRHHHPNQTLH